ncbi:MAG: hypothetical protein IH959_04380 [Chloroflexi bacterium]|nr:hypothetical protein [Chloroflexota bacterium]
MPDEPNPYLMQIYRRAFAAQDPALLQLSFTAAVLDKYRAAAGYELIRTDTVGRLKREGGWTIDLGIGDLGSGEEGGIIHACLRDVLHALPEAEREHWAQHVVALPMSRTFLQMRLAAGACIDDGEVRAWE